MNKAARSGHSHESTRLFPLCAGMIRAKRVNVMRVRQEKQLNAVASEVLALTAVVRPILKGVLYALKEDVVNKVGGA